MAGKYAIIRGIVGKNEFQNISDDCIQMKCGLFSNDEAGRNCAFFNQIHDIAAKANIDDIKFITLAGGKINVNIPQDAVPDAYYCNEDGLARDILYFMMQIAQSSCTACRHAYQAFDPAGHSEILRRKSAAAAEGLAKIFREAGMKQFA